MVKSNYVSKDDIDEFVERVMDDPSLREKSVADYRGSDDWTTSRPEGANTYKNRLGRRVWYLQHQLAKQYGCEACRANAHMVFDGAHDAININLGKRVYDPSNWSNFVRFIGDMAVKNAQRRNR